MVFFKQCEVRCMKDSLGGEQQGIFAKELIQKGEKVWTCKCGDLDLSFTRDQLLAIIAKNPKLEYFVRSFSYMLDDDLYAMPQTYMVNWFGNWVRLLIHTYIRISECTNKIDDN